MEFVHCKTIYQPYSTTLHDFYNTYKSKFQYLTNTTVKTINMSKRCFMFVGCSFSQSTLHFPDNTYFICFKNCILPQNVELKHCTVLTYFFLIDTPQPPIPDLFLLGNINTLVLNDVQLHNNKDIVLYLRNMFTPSEIYMSNISISSITNITKLKLQSKKLLLLSDDHSIYKGCRKIHHITIIEFLYTLHNKGYTLLFERSNHLESEICYSPDKLPFTLIGTARWFADMSNVFYIDNRWDEPFINTHLHIHKILSKEINDNIDRGRLISFVKTACRKMFSLYNMHYISQNFDTYIDKECEIDPNILKPLSLIMDANIIIHVVNSPTDKIAINAGEIHTNSILKFLTKYMNVQYTNIYTSKNRKSACSIIKQDLV